MFMHWYFNNSSCWSQWLNYFFSLVLVSLNVKNGTRIPDGFFCPPEQSFNFNYSSILIKPLGHYVKTSIKLGATKETNAFRRVVDESCLARVKRTTARLHKPFDIVFHGLMGKYNSLRLYAMCYKYIPPPIIVLTSTCY